MGNRSRLGGKVTVGILVILSLLSACGPQGAPPLPPPTRTPRPTPTPVPPTATSTPWPTPTPAPLITAPADGIPLHTMDVALNYADRRLEVAHRILFQNDSPDPWNEVVLAVQPAFQPDIFTLYIAEVTTAWEKQTAATTLDGTMLHVQLPVPALPGDPVQIYLSYAMQIPPVDPYAWLPRGNLGAGERLLQAGDWHPVLVPYAPGQGWRTWTFYAVGDPNVYPLANYDVQILTDPSVVIAAPGTFTRQGQARRYRLDHARAFAFLASPEYQVIEGAAGAAPVRVYFLPEYGVAAQAVLDTAEQAIPLYQELYGPYPTTGLVIAQNAYYGGMEYSGLISMSGYAYETYYANPLALLVDLTAHEIAHQWWYNAVGNDQVYEPWLDEAFAKYSELLFYERYYPDLTDWWWENHIYGRNPSGPLNRSIYDFSGTPAYIDQIYGQGARFMADLRALMGDPAFFAFIKDYRIANEGRIATQEDFFAAVRRHTDADLTPLLSAYFAP